DVGPARVAIAFRERVEHLRERERVGLELQRVDVHLVLLRRPAEAHDVDDARHGAQLPLHDPVLEGFQLERREARRAREGVTVDLAHGRRVGREIRLSSLGQRYGLQPLEGLVPRVGAVGIVLEDDRDGREAEDRNRAHGRAFRDPVHLVLDRNRDEAFDLLGRVAGKERDDLHLYVRDVGIRLDRQAQEREDAEGREDGEEREDDDAPVERVRDDRADHELFPEAKSDARRRLPSVTTPAPSGRPERTGTLPSRSTPTSTATRRKRAGPSATKQKRFPSSVRTARAGTTAAFAARLSTSTVTYISAFSSDTALSTLPRAFTVREAGSSASPTRPRRAGNARPGEASGRSARRSPAFTEARSRSVTS